MRQSPARFYLKVWSSSGFLLLAGFRVGGANEIPRSLNMLRHAE
jgi:hypothetical protein